MTAENLMTDGHSTDFGKWQTISPRHVVVGGGAKGFRDALAIARSGGGDLVVRGRGHSCNGQTLSCGVVFVNQDDDLQPRLTAEGHVEIPSGLDWYAVERWLNRRGRTIPILTDHLHVSVGGTVSVGGFGIHSIRDGLQGDQVVRLRILDGRGEATWCSRTEDHELFRFAAGGLGKAGFIDTVVMRTSEYRAYTHMSIVHHDSLAEMLEFAVAVTEVPGIDLYNGYSSANRIASEVGFRSDDPTPPGQQRLALLRDAQIETITDYPFANHSRRGVWMAHFPHHFPLWADYMLGADQMREFFGYVDRLCRIPPLSLTVKA
ncbi:MAG: FAD-binding protein, partial [Pseudonocardiaceae bacterium]